MPAIAIADLENAKTDVEHIAAVATSTDPTATDRLGGVKKTMAGASADVTAKVADVTAARDQAVNVTIPATVADVTAARDTAVNTTIPAKVAEVDAAVAATYVGQTKTYRDETEAFAASSGATFYDTIAAGLAATPSGATFGVRAGGADGLSRPTIYRDDAGVATLLYALIPASEYDAAISDHAGSRQIVLSSEYGKVALAVKDDGGVEVAELTSRTLIAAKHVNAAGSGMVELTPSGYVHAIVDDSGRAAFGVKNDGTAVAKDLEVTTVNGQNFNALVAIAGAPSAAATEKNYAAEIAMVLSYGQSLAVGADSVPILTSAQRFDNLRFAGGVRSQDSGTPYTALAPLTEQETAALGETPIAGATDIIKELIQSEDGLTYTQHAYQLLGCAPGASGQPISGLTKPGTAYTRFMNDVSNGYALSQSAGKTFKVPAFFWTQGESDYNLSTPASTYKASLIGLRNDVQADVQAVTGQTEPVVCISYQTHDVYSHSNNPYIAIAQKEVADSEAHHYLACPLYHLNTGPTHLTALNSKLLGAYYGLAYKRIVVDGLNWKPLQPISTTRQGSLVLARFNVPRGKLVFDTTTVTAQTNYGFSLVNAAGSAIAISAVEIVGPDTVKITAAASVPAGARLRYAHSAVGAGRGNLRDTQGETVIFNGGGINYALHNWCVIFSETLA